MFKIENDKTMKISRGERRTFKIVNKNGNFNIGDTFRLTIVEKKHYENVKFQKTYVNTRDTNEMHITLEPEDTMFCDVICKEKEYWYEIKYNDTQILVGYDEEDGEKEFVLFPTANIVE
jgi:hypothetical protein